MQISSHVSCERLKITSDSLWHKNNELTMSVSARVGVRVRRKCSGSAVFAGNATDITHTNDHTDNSSLFRDRIDWVASDFHPPASHVSEDIRTRRTVIAPFSLCSAVVQSLSHSRKYAGDPATSSAQHNIKLQQQMQHVLRSHENKARQMLRLVNNSLMQWTLSLRTIRTDVRTSTLSALQQYNG